MLRRRFAPGGLSLTALMFGLQVVAVRADDDAYMKAAKDYIAQAAAPVTTWEAPTLGPRRRVRSSSSTSQPTRKTGAPAG